MRKYFVILLVSFAGFNYASAQTDIDMVDESQTDIRVNPESEFAESDYDNGITIPSYIKTDSNHIALNGNNWKALRMAASKVSNRPLSIVHIGDSHLQADFSTSHVREMLQLDLGNAGRGLVAPLKMSGTNQPFDYTFMSSDSWEAAKLMKSPWGRTMGFTGTSVSPNSRKSELTIATKGEDDYNPFSDITVFHNGQFFVTAVYNEDGQPIPFFSIPSKDYTQIMLEGEYTCVTISFDSAGDLTIYGANLSGHRPGVFYHTIGNNGATFDTYNRIGTVGEGLKPLAPDLVIISLGTNEAFGRIDPLAFTTSIDKLLTNIRESNPNVQFLLVTPMECQRANYKSVTKRVPSKRRKGKRRTRTVTSRVKNYGINHNILPLRNAIIEYGKTRGIPVYDWYEVSGGDNSSGKWLSDDLYGKDRVHLTRKGYRLQGELLYKALREALGY